MANYGWSDLTTLEAYPFYQDKPPSPELDVFAESIGPMALNDSRGRLDSRWWLCYQLPNGDVIASGATGLVYDSPSVVFNEPLEIAHIALTFDQLGRALVFYRTGASDLKLYWFDPVLETNTVKSIGSGTYPTACFDYPTNTNLDFTDAHIFYINSAGLVKNRVQRDRFETEYQVQRAGVDLSGARIVSAGLTTGNRLQVVAK